MRAALGLLDFEDGSIADVRDLLVRAMFAPAFLRCSEGRRFLSHLFTLQAGLWAELLWLWACLWNAGLKPWGGCCLLPSHRLALLLGLPASCRKRSYVAVTATQVSNNCFRCQACNPAVSDSEASLACSGSW